MTEELSVFRELLDNKLESFSSIYIDASNTSSPKCYAYKLDGMGEEFTELLGVYSDVWTIPRLIFHVFAIEMDFILAADKVNHCVGSSNGRLWNATYSPVDDGFSIKIELESEFSLHEFMRLEYARLKAFAEDYHEESLKSPESAPSHRPLVGRHGWQDKLMSFRKPS